MSKLPRLELNEDDNTNKNNEFIIFRHNSTNIKNKNKINTRRKVRDNINTRRKNINIRKRGKKKGKNTRKFGLFGFLK